MYVDIEDIYKVGTSTVYDALWSTLDVLNKVRQLDIVFPEKHDIKGFQCLECG